MFVLFFLLFTHAGISETLDFVPDELPFYENSEEDHTEGKVDVIFQEKSINQFGLKEGEIALTFDDGPAPSTPKVLKILKDRGIHATFFLVGRQALLYPNILEQIAKDHHVMGNHTQNHKLKYDSAEQLYSEVAETDKIIAPYVALSGTKRFYFRAPGGAWDLWHYKTLSPYPNLTKYVGPIYWNIGARVTYNKQRKLQSAADWECWAKHISPRSCAEAYYKELMQKKKGVILIHDITNNSVEMLKELLALIEKNGIDGKRNGTWTFKTLDELTFQNELEI